jgi:hypothetical protein
VSVPPTTAQTTAVWLAFVAAALSFTAVIVTAIKTGRIEVTPLFGGILMFLLGVAGYRRLKRN